MSLQKQVVHTTSLFEVDDKFNDPRFMRVRIASMHSGINRNNSRFSVDCIKKAKNSFANIPILADVQEYEDNDGNHYLDYAGHSMHIENDSMNDGEEKMIYDEKVVGIVPETNNFELVYDEETGNEYAMVDALLYREYGNYACDILEKRGGKTDVSAEIACTETSYSASDKCLDVGQMQMCAITLLGDSVTPGMAKAHAEVFELKESRQDQLIQIMQELKESLDNYNALLEHNTKEGGTDKVDNEILEEVAETTEEEAVEEVAEETTEEVTVEEEISEDAEEVTPDEEVAEEEEVVEQNSIKYEITRGEDVKEFAVSLSDVMYALSDLVNETYAEEGTWYGVEVYADDKYVIMMDYMTGRAYKQTYTVKGDSYRLTGDRVPVKSIFVTADEEKALDDMRTNYSTISDKLAKYEAEPQKMEILNSEAYSQIAELEEFATLKEQESHFDMSVEDVQKKADELLLNYAKAGKLEFSAQTEQKEVKAVKFADNKKKTSRYGNLFSK